MNRKLSPDAVLEDADEWFHNLLRWQQQEIYMKAYMKHAKIKMSEVAW